MRQAEDLPYRNLLTRARAGTLTNDDMLTLNSKAITSLTNPHLQTTTAIVKLNALRHVINRFQIERFARLRHQRIIIFPAVHTRTRSSGPTDLTLHADDLLGLPEQRSSRTGRKDSFSGTYSLHTFHADNDTDKHKHACWISQWRNWKGGRCCC